MSRLARLLSLTLLAAGACSAPASGTPHEETPPPEPPRLVLERVSLHQRAPGESDGISGAAGAVIDGAWAVVLGADGGELGRAAVAGDGSFAEVAIGDNAHAAVRVLAVSADGTATAEAGFANDVVAPAVAFSATPRALEPSAAARFEFGGDEEGCVFVCGLEGGPLAPCTSPVTLEQDDGDWTFVVRAADPAGNAAEARWTWTIDTVPPAALIVEAPPALGNSNSALFRFACDEASCTYECGLDGALPSSCTAEIEWLIFEGPHTLVVQAIDAAGNGGDPATHAWMVDQTMPSVRLIDGPAGTVSSTTATFAFESSEPGSTFVCGLDAGPLEPCVSPHELAGVTAGEHSFSVVAIEPAGNSSYPAVRTWTVVPTAWAQLSGAEYRTCGVTTRGELFCWGKHPDVLAGEGFETHQVPTQVGPDTDWARVATGSGHACAIKTSGELHCWGANHSGQLGDETSAPRESPVRVGSSADWSRVAVGAQHTCGIRTSGQLFCWGDNAAGQLGDDSPGFQPAPVPVDTASDWTEVAAGDLHTCGLRTTGRLECWGASWFGQVGAGTVTETSGRVTVDGSTTWIGVTAAGRHTCAIDSTDALSCWGDDERGQLGDGPSTAHPPQEPQPVAIAGGGAWSSVVAGDHSTCAIRTTGQLLCWGGNDHGELGDGTALDRASPVAVGDATDWNGLALGWAHACGIRGPGEAYCWGDDTFGQLGNGPGGGPTSVPVPVDLSMR